MGPWIAMYPQDLGMLWVLLNHMPILAPPEHSVHTTIEASSGFCLRRMRPQPPHYLYFSPYSDSRPPLAPVLLVADLIRPAHTWGRLNHELNGNWSDASTIEQLVIRGEDFLAAPGHPARRASVALDDRHAESEKDFGTSESCTVLA